MHTIQNSDAWKAYRRGKISASKIPIIMGESPYTTPYELFMEETGLVPPQETQPHMKRGLDIEDEARASFELETGIKMLPAVVVHPDNPLFIASLDGLSADGQCLVEIKNNNKEFHEASKFGCVPKFHVAQVNWQMYVSGAKHAYYYSYRSGDPFLTEIIRNDTLIAEMVEQANKFLLLLENLTPPPLSDRDYEDRSNDHYLSNLAVQYHGDQILQKFYEERAERTKDEIKRICGERNAKGPNWKLTRFEEKGRVDYGAIPELKNIDLDQYRKPPIAKFRITTETT